MILLPCKRKVRTRLNVDTFKEDSGAEGERKTSALVLGAGDMIQYFLEIHKIIFKKKHFLIFSMLSL